MIKYIYHKSIMLFVWHPLAAPQGREGCIRALLDGGASHAELDDDGSSALWVAAAHGQYGSAAELLGHPRNPADVDYPDEASERNPVRVLFAAPLPRLFAVFSFEASVSDATMPCASGSPYPRALIGL